MRARILQEYGLVKIKFALFLVTNSRACPSIMCCSIPRYLPDSVGDGGKDKEQSAPSARDGICCETDEIQGQTTGGQGGRFENLKERIDGDYDEFKPIHADVAAVGYCSKLRAEENMFGKAVLGGCTLRDLEQHLVLCHEFHRGHRRRSKLLLLVHELIACQAQGGMLGFMGWYVRVIRRGPPRA